MVDGSARTPSAARGAARFWAMQLTVERLTPALGAEISGLDPLDPLTAELADELYRALIEHQVIILRDLDLGPRRMVELGRQLGTLGARHHSYVTHPDSGDVVVLEWGGSQKPGLGLRQGGSSLGVSRAKRGQRPEPQRKSRSLRISAAAVVLPRKVR